MRFAVMFHKDQTVYVALTSNDVEMFKLQLIPFFDVAGGSECSVIWPDSGMWIGYGPQLTTLARKLQHDVAGAHVTAIIVSNCNTYIWFRKYGNQYIYDCGADVIHDIPSVSLED